MINTKKRIITISVYIISVIIIANIVSFYNDWRDKSSIIKYVKSNYEELDKYALTVKSDNYSDDSLYYNGWSVSYWDKTGMIEFTVIATGIVSSSTYKGFYYSPEDIPLGFQGEPVEFDIKGNGWYWEENPGNGGYTERIVTNWFLFEAYF